MKGVQETAASQSDECAEGDQGKDTSHRSDLSSVVVSTFCRAALESALPDARPIRDSGGCGDRDTRGVDEGGASYSSNGANGLSGGSTSAGWAKMAPRRAAQGSRAIVMVLNVEERCGRPQGAERSSGDRLRRIGPRMRARIHRFCKGDERSRGVDPDDDPEVVAKRLQVLEFMPVDRIETL